ncbi:MAG TPA: FAD:protein FMN transferase [Ktedonobacterales bacterium]
MARVAFAAMGTTVSLLLPGGDAETGGALARELFEEWERTLSRFRPESELSRLNARVGETVAISPLLCEVLAAALAAASATGGLYDPTLLHQIVAVGYGRSFDELPRAQGLVVDLGALRPGGDWRGVALDTEARTVRLPRGAGLDFGGIAKGMAVDATLARLPARGITAALVNAGGDLAVMGLPPGVEAWTLTVPGRGRDAQWAIPLRRGALATSGIARRRWRQGDAQRHHLLDPRTGMPAESGLWSVTVAAEQCAQAEVAAKVAFVLGASAGAAFLERIGLAGVLVHEDGQLTTAGDWPREMAMVAAEGRADIVGASGGRPPVPGGRLRVPDGRPREQVEGSRRGEGAP